MFYRQHWTDQRLKFDQGAVEKIVGGQEIVDRIWVPDTFVYNAHWADLSSQVT